MSYLSKLLSKLESLKTRKNISLTVEDTEVKTPSLSTESRSDLVSSDNGACHGVCENSQDKDASLLCEVCVKSPSKYTCPGCGLKTCSLPCVKEHKVKLSCSGERVKTAFVDKSQYSDRHLLNDYRFLENAERSVYSNKIVPKNRHSGSHHQYRTSPYYHIQHSKRATILMGAARKRGINLRMMPDHLEKHKSNTSFYTISTDVIEWHIEWQFVTSNCLIKDEKVPESTVLMEVVNKHGNAVDHPHLRKALEDYRKKFHLCRYLIKVEGMPANRKRYIELYPSLTVGENLKGLCLVEHPTILVLPPSHSGSQEFQLLDKDVDLAYMQTGNMRHLTRHHPDFSQQEIIQDQILDPKSSVYRPGDDDSDDDDDDDGQVVISDDCDG